MISTTPGSTWPAGRKAAGEVCTCCECEAGRRWRACLAQQHSMQGWEWQVESWLLASAPSVAAPLWPLPTQPGPHLRWVRLPPLP